MARRLIEAARSGSRGPESLRSLLKAPAWPDYADDLGRTPLAVAAFGGHLESVRLLCEAGADKDRAALDGATPLGKASV